jgi:16S rRNA (guanine966-N2)-methyltransferase
VATRPTTDRVREALFAMLGRQDQLRVLDLYSGSGALGLEALSRGAARVVMVESARSAIACIRQNLQELGVGPEVTLVPARVERSRARLEPLGPFDLVLCDPPWHEIEACVRELPRLLGGGLLGPDATLVLEHSAREGVISLEPLAGPSFDRRTYGDTGLSLFRVPGGI